MFLPPGVATDASWCSFHNSYGATGDALAVIGYCGAALPLAALTANASARWVEGGFTYQRIYSNDAAAHGGDPCVPALSVPYYNVSGPTTWATTTNNVAHVALTGWSTAEIEDWAVGAYIDGAGPVSPTITFEGGSTVVANGKSFPAVNNGQTVTLTVTFPPTAQRFSFAVIRVWSERLNAAHTGARAGKDITHPWVVGVYIP